MCLAETEELRPEMQDIPSREPIDQLRGMDMDGDLEALGTPQEEMARLQKLWNEGKDRYNEGREGINRKNEQKPLISETESDLEKLREYGWL